MIKTIDCKSSNYLNKLKVILEKRQNINYIDTKLPGRTKWAFAHFFLGGIKTIC